MLVVVPTAGARPPGDAAGVIATRPASESGGGMIPHFVFMPWVEAARYVGSAGSFVQPPHANPAAGARGRTPSFGDRGVQDEFEIA